MRETLFTPREKTQTRSLRPRLPRSVRGWLLLGLTALALGIAGFAAAYVALFNGSSAAPLGLSSSTAPGGALSSARAAGTWSLGSSSVVGYRVREKLAFLPAKSDAVGRTSDVAGTLSAGRSGSELTVTAARFEADVRTLKSDRSMRDARIHSIGVQSDQYPTAGFRLTKAIVLPASALHGQVFHVKATGLLTIHGTTRSVTIPLTGRLTNGEVETVGSITFPFTEFGMQAPNVAGFVSVENHATLEFDLRFKQGASGSVAAKLRTIAAAKPSKSTGGFPGPGGGPGPNGPGPNNKQFQAFATCMGQHGVKMSAGPPGSGNGPSTAQNPKMAAALKACASLQPKGAPGIPPGAGQTP